REGLLPTGHTARLLHALRLGAPLAGIGIARRPAAFASRVQVDGACNRLPKQSSRCRLACRNWNFRGISVAPPRRQRLQLKYESLAHFHFARLDRAQSSQICWIVRRNISGRALQYAAVSGGTLISRSSS